MAIPDRRQRFVRHCRWLALLLEILVVLALLSGAFPLSLTNPVWHLRLADAAVGLAPVLLMAVILLHLGSVLVAPDSELGLGSGLRSVQLANRWALVFAVLVPLQLLGFAWLWMDSHRQLEVRINRLDGQRAALLSPLLASGSGAELRQRLAEAPANGFPPPPVSLLPASEPLATQKQRLNQATLGAFTQLKANLRSERQTMLRNSLPGALRGLIGATLISVFLVTITRRS
jgi:hypothetical protein